MKSKYMNFFVAILLMFPIIRVHANNIILDCPDAVRSNSQFTCNIKGKSENVISSIAMKVDTSSSLEYIGFVSDKLWQGNGANKSIDLFGGNGIGIFDVGILTLKSGSKNENVLSLSSIIFFDEDYNEISVNNVSKVIKIKDNSNDEKHKLEDSKKDYIDKSTSVNSNNKVDNSTNVNLNFETGNDNKTDDEETMNENLKDDTEKINYISDILIDNYNLDFVQGKFSYTLKINDDNNLNINPIGSRNDLLYEIIGNNNLQDKSVIKINILLNNEIVEVYELNIIKKNDKALNYNFIFIIIICLLFLINILRIIFKRRKNEKKNV